MTDGMWSFSRTKCLFALGLVACSGAAAREGGDDDASVDASATSDASAPDGVSTSDTGAIPDADDGGFVFDGNLAFDAASLPPAFQACATCMVNTCAPEIEQCEQDVPCQEILTCVVESACLLTDAGETNCITACGADSGLTNKQIIEAAKLLNQVATTCASCIVQCPKPDGGA